MEIRTMETPAMKTRIATREESVALVNQTVRAVDRQTMKLPDGDRDATRLLLDETGAVVCSSQAGAQMYCAPWLLADVFHL